MREAAGSEAFVWADANQGYDLHQAREAAPASPRPGWTCSSNPCPPTGCT